MTLDDKAIICYIVHDNNEGKEYAFDNVKDANVCYREWMLKRDYEIGELSFYIEIKPEYLEE